MQCSTCHYALGEIPNSKILPLIDCVFPISEAEFSDVTGTKVLRVFLLAILNHLYEFYSLPQLTKSGLKLVCNVNMYTETSSLRTVLIMPRNLNEIVRS